MITRPTPTDRQFNFEDFADAAREQGQEASVIVRAGMAIFTLTDHGQTIELTAGEAAQFVLRHEENQSRLCNGPSNIEYLRPPLGTLGDCLAETASHQPYGYARLTGCAESFWRDIPADGPDKHWFVLDGVTACLDPAPVTIFVSNGTTAATAREILKQAAKWLRDHGDELHELTPQEPEPTAGDLDDLPF